MRILIAEDNPTTRTILKAILLKWGHEVVATTNGEEAWEILTKGDAPKLAILDWIMPGISGDDLCRRLRARPDIRPLYLILLTVKVDNTDVIEGLEAGADDYIRKPYNLEDLRARVGVGARVIKLATALADRVAELEKAAEHIKKLQGVLPICMYCHSIRTDKKSWQRIESYLSEHADVQFSHGICAACAKTHFDNLGLKHPEAA